MSATNRAAKIAKLHKVAKKKYSPVSPAADRSVLEHMLYACCLENSKFEHADEAFARIQNDYSDWNEIRVTTVQELSEAMNCLHAPEEAAIRLKRTLHSMFETYYSFDMDDMKKKNLGIAVQQMEKFNGITPFVVSYVAQSSLGGHSIGVDNSLIMLMQVLDVISEAEAKKKVVPGMERAIPKTKGIEFFSVVHQLAVAFHSSPFNNEIRKIIFEVDPSSKERMPKRGGKKKKKAVNAKVAPAKKSKATAEKKDSKGRKAKATTAKKATPKKKTASKKAAKKASTKKPAAKTVKKKTKVAAANKATRKKIAKKSPAKKKSPTKRLARKKPR